MYTIWGLFFESHVLLASGLLHMVLSRVIVRWKMRHSDLLSVQIEVPVVYCTAGAGDYLSVGIVYAITAVTCFTF